MKVQLTCGRCGKQEVVNSPDGHLAPPPGWFELEPTDWRCGCILTVPSDCDADVMKAA